MSKIIAAIDFSDVSERVLQEAVTIGKALAIPVSVLNVVSHAPAVMGDSMMPITPSSEEIDDANAKSKEKLAAWVNANREHLVLGSVAIDVCIYDGSPVESILKHARETMACRIVLGSHGHGAFYNLLLGSVSEGVIRNSPCPVLIVPSRIKVCNMISHAISQMGNHNEIR
jgi:nucleotide-binding universal stress UspA family protein